MKNLSIISRFRAFSDLSASPNHLSSPYQTPILSQQENKSCFFHAQNQFNVSTPKKSLYSPIRKSATRNIPSDIEIPIRQLKKSLTLCETSSTSSLQKKPITTKAPKNSKFMTKKLKNHTKFEKDLTVSLKKPLTQSTFSLRKTNKLQLRKTESLTQKIIEKIIQADKSLEENFSNDRELVEISPVLKIKKSDYSKIQLRLKFLSIPNDIYQDHTKSSNDTSKINAHTSRSPQSKKITTAKSLKTAKRNSTVSLLGERRDNRSKGRQLRRTQSTINNSRTPTNKKSFRKERSQTFLESQGKDFTFVLPLLKRKRHQSFSHQKKIVNSATKEALESKTPIIKKSRGEFQKSITKADGIFTEAINKFQVPKLNLDLCFDNISEFQAQKKKEVKNQLSDYKELLDTSKQNLTVTKINTIEIGHGERSKRSQKASLKLAFVLNSPKLTIRNDKRYHSVKNNVIPELSVTTSNEKDNQQCMNGMLRTESDLQSIIEFDVKQLITGDC